MRPPVTTLEVDVVPYRPPSVPRTIPPFGVEALNATIVETAGVVDWASKGPAEARRQTGNRNRA
jgi:hypothetical protein